METDTDRIRRLLDSYYAGEATEAEVRQITSYFSRARSLSPELESERRAFEAMHPAEGELTPPERLTRYVARIGRRSPFVVAVRWSAAVAAVVAGVFVCVNFFGKGMDASIDRSVFADVTARGCETDSVSDIRTGRGKTADFRPVSTDSVAVAGAVSPVESSDAVKRNPAKRRAGGKKRGSDEKERKAIEVSVELLNRTLSKVSLACVDVEAKFEEVNDVLKEL